MEVVVAAVVGVHGIAQQVKGESVLHAEWFAPMVDGVRFAGGDLTPGDLCCVSYGQVFRPPGRPLAGDLPPLGADEVTEGFDEELLALWWAEAAQVDDQVIAPDARSLMRTPRSVQAALRALSGSRFFAGLALRAMVFDLHQVRRYLTEPDVHAWAQRQLAQAIGDDTRVIVAHSLGSVVAYEALCANPHWPVQTLVTLGSPLGVRNLIFDRLRPTPTPTANGGTPRGVWPGPVQRWTNIADAGDVVALVKDLKPLFGERLRGFVVHNAANAHDVAPYLTAPQTGAAIRAGLAD
jgi:pimeloyl-ACP methyl ester carboxylesterase